MVKSRWLWMGMAAAVAVGVSQAAQAAGDSLKGEEIRIGAIVPSSGPFAEWGKTNTITLQMLEDQVNKAGGVDGATLKIIIYDDGAKPAQSANLIRKLADDDHVLAIAGPLTSSSAEVAFPVDNQLKIVSTSQASSKPGVSAKNRPWAFRNSVDEGTLARASVPFLKKAYNVKTVAIIYDAKDANSTAVATKIMPKIMADNGIKVLNGDSPLTFHTGDIDVSAQVTSLKGLNPDALVVGADYSQAVTVLREMKRQGLIKPIIGGTPLISSAILKAAPEIPIISVATYYAGISGARAEAFTAALTPMLRKAGGLPADVEPNMFDASIYEIVEMYIQAIEKAGVTGKPDQLAADREKIMHYLTHLTDFQGLSGPVSFNADGDGVKTFFVVLGEHGKWTEKVRGCSVAGKC